jgi:hypothetical protein
MFEYFEDLRKKPEPEKKRAVFKLSLLITLGILIIWIVALSLRISQTDFSFGQGRDVKDMPSITDTLKTFFGRVGDIIENKTDTTN